MLAFVLKKNDDRLLGALLLQKCKDFKVYLPEGELPEAEDEGKLTIVSGGLQQVEEPLLCVLEEGALPDRHFVRRVLRTVRRHPEFSVYHVNRPGTKAWPRKISAVKLFRQFVLEGLQAPLSSFVFRTEAFREKAVFLADGTLDTMATVLSCAKEQPVRNVWHQTLQYTPPVAEPGLAAEEKRIRRRLEFLRWSELFFGEEDYPLSIGTRLDVFASEVAKFYPARPMDELKEEMAVFQVSQGTLRKMRAASALKSAVKERQKTL